MRLFVELGVAAGFLCATFGVSHAQSTKTQAQTTQVGRLRICASLDVPFKEVGGLVFIPRYLMFYEAGKLIGSLRKAQREPRSTLSLTPLGTVITTSTATLTANNPCANVTASTLISTDWFAFTPLIRKADGFILEATQVVGFNHPPSELPHGLGNALPYGIFAQALTDIAEPILATTSGWTDTEFAPLSSDEIAALPVDPRQMRTHTKFDLAFGNQLRETKSLEEVQLLAGSGGALVEVNPGKPDHKRIYRWMNDQGSLLDVDVTDSEPMKMQLRTDGMENVWITSGGRFECSAIPPTILGPTEPCHGE